MINHKIDHSLNTIRCTIEGMEAVMQMMMEVTETNPDAVGYLMLSCIASVRQECDVIEKEMSKL